MYAHETLYLLYESHWNELYEHFDVKLAKIYRDERLAYEKLQEYWDKDCLDWDGRIRSLSSGTITEYLTKTRPDGTTLQLKYPKFWIHHYKQGTEIPTTFLPTQIATVKFTKKES